MNTWFITGSSSGIGAGIAQAALELGDNVVVMARKVESLDQFVKKYPTRVLALPLELTDRTSIYAAVEQANARFGGIDILVNNAGHGYRAAVEEGESKNVAEIFQTNFFGAVELIKLILPQMREKHSGAIINISSIAAVSSGVGSGYYASTKAALELLSDALYQEVSPLGIKVMVVEPGAFRTRFYDDSLKGTQIKIADYAQTAGTRRKENIVNLHNQQGDPIKAGKVIVETIGKKDYPRTLLLGSDAVRFVRTQLQMNLEEITQWNKVSNSTDFDS